MRPLVTCRRDALCRSPNGRTTLERLELEALGIALGQLPGEEGRVHESKSGIQPHAWVAWVAFAARDIGAANGWKWSDPVAMW
jgi:hypothetical protein